MAGRAAPLIEHQGVAMRRRLERTKLSLLEAHLEIDAGWGTRTVLCAMYGSVQTKFQDAC